MGPIVLVVLAAVAARASALVALKPPLTPPAIGKKPVAAECAYESPVLEPILLSSTLTQDEKIDAIADHYNARPWLVAARLGEIGVAAARSYGAWTRGDASDFDVVGAREARARAERPGASARAGVLRDEVSKLGVVFVKLAQTMATRADIIGEEAAAALESLQDRNAPFPDALARAAIEADLAGAPLELVELSASPIAAASIAQVYRGATAGGADVAVKVRRPGVVEQVALDSYAVRLLLKGLQVYWNTNHTDYPAIVDEVTAGLFRELDFRLEAANAARFWEAHAADAAYLRVPRAGFARGGGALGSVTPRVHVAEWVDGKPLGALSRERQRAMVQKGLDVCFLQLFGTGFVHADPHYGNMMYDDDDKLVLLDFGLVTNLTLAQTEAMAGAVAAIVGEDWAGLLEAFREIGLVPPRPSIWVDARTGKPINGLLPGVWTPCSEEEFVAGFVDALEKSAGEAGSFTEITARLTELALSYQFILPPWLLFVVRAVITLDGFAAGMDPPLSALAAAAPHAACRVLAPRTPRGEAKLRAALLTEAGALDVGRLKTLAAAAAEMPCEADACSVETAAAAKDDAANVVARVASLLLEDADGRALRRVAYDVDVAPLVEDARAAAFAALRSECPPPAALAGAVRAALAAPVRALRRRRRPTPADAARVRERDDPMAGDADLFEPAPSGVAAVPPAWRRRRVARTLLARHARLLAASPKSLAALAGLFAALAGLAARVVASDLARAAASLGRRWLPRGRAPPPPAPAPA